MVQIRIQMDEELRKQTDKILVVNRQEAVNSFIQLAQSHPIKFDDGFKFNREGCYEDE